MTCKSKPITVGPALAILALSAAPAAAGQVLYVDDDAAPLGDGLSWPTAYRFLQDALADAAASGGTVNAIHVAQGVYTPNLDESNPDGYSNCCEPNGGVGCDDTACQTAVCDVLPPCCEVEWDVDCADLAAELCPTLCADPRLATFQLLDGVSLLGGYAGPGEADPDVCAPELYETALSGDFAGDDGPGPFDNNVENAYTVVTGSGTNDTAVIDGFTISGGNANGPNPGELEWRRGGGMWTLTGSPTIQRCRFEHNYADAYGGGMYNRIFSSPLIEDCSFSGNVSGIGGGAMFNTGASLPQITGCLFELNDAAGGSGGAMFNAPDSDATITGCSFDSNTAIAGGAIYNNESGPAISGCQFTGNFSTSSGGAIFNNVSSPSIADCSFDGNASDGGGGALTNFDSSSATIENCTFTYNTTPDAGGAIRNSVCDPTITGCTFHGNTALTGGGMYNYTASPAITHCVFTSNQTTGSGAGGGGLLNSTDSSPSITNCLFADNSAASTGGGIGNGINSNPAITNCTVVYNTAAIAGGGIYTTDAFGGHSTPVVVNCIVYGNNDVQILDDAGSVTTVSHSNVQGGFAGAGNIDADPRFADADYRLGSGSPSIDAGNNSAVTESTDLDGNPRLVDDPCREDTGDGPLPVVDMGAYEFQASSCDVNGDGSVAVNDFLLLLSGWGDCPDPCPPSCPADFDGDCTVGVVDFLILLANWG
jgi:hypothetical protein